MFIKPSDYKNVDKKPNINLFTNNKTTKQNVVLKREI